MIWALVTPRSTLTTLLLIHSALLIRPSFRAFVGSFPLPGTSQIPVWLTPLPVSSLLRFYLLNRSNLTTLFNIASCHHHHHLSHTPHIPDLLYLALLFLQYLLPFYQLCILFINYTSFVVYLRSVKCNLHNKRDFYSYNYA